MMCLEAIPSPSSSASQVSITTIASTTLTSTEQPTVPRHSRPPQNTRSQWRALSLFPAVDTSRALSRILRWAPVAGIVILLCIGLINVFGALTGKASAPPSHPAPRSTTISPSRISTVFTSDGLITVTLDVSPNHTGANISLFTTMLDMKMATTSMPLHPDGQGHFQGTAELSMGGDWGLRMLIQTPDHKLHEAHIHLLTPA